MTYEEMVTKFLGKKIYSKRFWDPKELYLAIGGISNVEGVAYFTGTLFNRGHEISNSWRFKTTDDMTDWLIIEDRPKSHLPDYL